MFSWRKSLSLVGVCIVAISRPAIAQRALPAVFDAVTIDNVAGIATTAASLRQLAAARNAPWMARVVFDASEPAAYYGNPLQVLGQVGFIMGGLLDSSDESKTTVAQHNARADQYFAELGKIVDLWEIGNEVNGDWTGDPSAMQAKTYYAWSQAHSRGYKTALTLYYDDPCPSGGNDHRMLNWAQARIPADMARGLDYVLISYYPQTCNGSTQTIQTWISVFGQLAALFPNSKLGFGEVGTVKARADASSLNQILSFYYGLTPVIRARLPNFSGGYFDWFFKEQSVPFQTSPGNFNASWLALYNAVHSRPE